MRPAEFSPDTIIQAGTELQATGRNVTGFALRQRVGGGNPARLRQVWDEHVSRSAAPAAPVAELPDEVAQAVAAISAALSERLAALAVELNDKTVKAAERRVAEVLRATGEQRVQAERELADAAQTVDEVEERLDAAQAELVDLRGQLDAVRATAQEQALELAALKVKMEVDQVGHAAQTQRAADAEAARDAARREVGAAREEAARLHGQIEALQEQQAALLAALGPRAGA